MGEVMELLDTTILEAEETAIIKPDPASPMKDFAETLNEKREYLRQVEAGEIPYNPELVSKFADEIREIQLHIQTPVERVLETDVSFEIGKYHISDLADGGKAMLREFVREVMDVLIRKQKALFPDRTFLVTVRTTGYADGISLGWELRKRLTQGMEEPLPQEAAEARQVLNRELSLRRAESISTHIMKELENQLGDTTGVIIGVPEIMGMGEELPYPGQTISPPYKVNDKRRRICKVYGRVFRQ